MKVLKFGGSSLRDGQAIEHVGNIVAREAQISSPVVVLSAMKGVTDLLIEAARNAEHSERGYSGLIDELERRTREAVYHLFGDDGAGSAMERLTETTRELRDILHGIELVRECSGRTLDLVMSFGERLSCMLFAEYLSFTGTPAEYLDARDLIVTDESHGNARVVFDDSFRRIRERLRQVQAIPVITGFIASTPEGITTTIGRNGSDYTASIIGAGLEAEAVEIWKDVDGVMSADPRSVKDAFVLPEISVEEAMELSYFGAEVIHPYTMIPVFERSIPIIIRNTLKPEAPGTRIVKGAAKSGREITGIASIENVALINIEGGGMVGMPGIASRIFAAFAKAGTNIIMISQASSEHSICVVLRAEEAERTLRTLHRELSWELESRTIERFQLVRDLEIIAVIGENMRGRPGISGRLFSALGEEKINILAIAQGSSERNISFVIARRDREKALSTVHRAFLG